MKPPKLYAVESCRLGAEIRVRVYSKTMQHGGRLMPNKYGTQWWLNGCSSFNARDPIGMALRDVGFRDPRGGCSYDNDGARWRGYRMPTREEAKELQEAGWVTADEFRALMARFLEQPSGRRRRTASKG